MKNKKDSKTEYEDLENPTTSVLAECIVPPMATETIFLCETRHLGLSNHINYKIIGLILREI